MSLTISTTQVRIEEFFDPTSTDPINIAQSQDVSATTPADIRVDTRRENPRRSWANAILSPVPLQNPTAVA